MKEVRQTGEYRYTFGPNYEPVATVEPGETFVVYTADAFENRINRPEDLPSKVLSNVQFTNPQTGPILVKGAEKGDTLSVKILNIEPLRKFAVSAFIPYFGGLTNTNSTPMLNEPLPERVFIYAIKDDKIELENGVRIPYAPFLGTIGTAPEIESINTLTPGYWGGNMDCPETCPGNEVQLPVFVKDAHFFTGDVHAAQGDGELCGVACEIPARVTIMLDVVKGKKIRWPRIISKEHIMAVGSARPMEDAARIAWSELINFMVEEYGYEKLEAYQLLTQVGVMRVGNMVDPNYSLVAKCPKEYLRKHSG